MFWTAALMIAFRLSPLLMFWAAALLPRSIELLPFLPAVEYFWPDVIIWVLLGFYAGFLLKSKVVW